MTASSLAGAAVAVVLGGGLALGCGHTKSVAEPSAQEQRAAEKDERAKTGATKAGTPKDGAAKAGSAKDETATPKSNAPHRHARGEPPAESRAHARPGRGAPLATSPEGLLTPGSAKKIQEKLHDSGHLKEAVTGELDGPTREALRRFQRDEGLPDTGMPDHETVKRLGLDPDDVFRRQAPEERKYTPAAGHEGPEDK